MCRVVVLSAFKAGLLVAEGTPFSYNLKEGIVCSRELTRAAVSESHLSSPGLLCRRAHHQRSGKRTGRDGSRDVARQSSGWSPASSWVGRPWCQRWSESWCRGRDHVLRYHVDVHCGGLDSLCL